MKKIDYYGVVIKMNEKYGDMELLEKIVKGEIDKEIVEKAKNEVLERWKKEGYDINEVKNMDIDEFLNRFNITDEYKKKLIKEILEIGIKKDVIIAFPYPKYLTIRLINGLIIHDLDKMSLTELEMLYKRMRIADVKKLFFTKKNLFWYWQ
jgi:hypothetical protein